MHQDLIHSRHYMKKVLLIAFSMFVLLTACTKEDTNPPVVVSSTPANGEKEIDPSLEGVTVEFNEVMNQNKSSWSAEDGDTFPELNGEAYFISEGRKNVLPVKLEANKNYVLWLNKEGQNEFRDDSGNILAPYKLEFSTGDAANEEEEGKANLKISS